LGYRKRQDEQERIKRAKEEIRRERAAENAAEIAENEDDDEASSPSDRPRRERKKKKFFDGVVGQIIVISYFVWYKFLAYIGIHAIINVENMQEMQEEVL